MGSVRYVFLKKLILLYSMNALD